MAQGGFAFCQGQILSIAQNTALFSLLGTTYGGNGQTTFALPDLRGRSPIGVGQGPGLQGIQLGEVLGTETASLTNANLPAHAHTVTPGAATSASSKVPTGRVPGLTGAAAYADAATTAMAATTTSVAGSSAPFSTRSPALGMGYCIALEGVFPSRN